MRTENIKNVANRLIESDEKAILISGPWGIGKTYEIKEFIKSKKEDTKGFRKSEFKYGEFTRTVYFPQEINVDKTTAKLENGILHIDAPKLVIEKQDKKKLQIQ